MWGSLWDCSSSSHYLTATTWETQLKATELNTVNTQNYWDNDNKWQLFYATKFGIVCYAAIDNCIMLPFKGSPHPLTNAIKSLRLRPLLPQLRTILKHHSSFGTPYRLLRLPAGLLSQFNVSLSLSLLNFTSFPCNPEMLIPRALPNKSSAHWSPFLGLLAKDPHGIVCFLLVLLNTGGNNVVFTSHHSSENNPLIAHCFFFWIPNSQWNRSRGKKCMGITFWKNSSLCFGSHLLPWNGDTCCKSLGRIGQMASHIF